MKYCYSLTRLAKFNWITTRSEDVGPKRGPAYTGTYLEVNLEKRFKVLKMYHNSTSGTAS